MKKYLAPLGLLCIAGAFVILQADSKPAFAAKDPSVAVAPYETQFRQDTVPGSDTSKMKKKWKHKNKERKDTSSSWPQDTIPNSIP